MHVNYITDLRLLLGHPVNLLKLPQQNSPAMQGREMIYGKIYGNWSQNNGQTIYYSELCKMTVS